MALAAKKAIKMKQSDKARFAAIRLDVISNRVRADKYDYNELQQLVDFLYQLSQRKEAS